MNLTTTFKDELEFAWWVEIITKQPCCTYYFGPFFSQQEAQWFLPGYLEDLEQERYQEICIQIKQCQPRELTLFEEEWKYSFLLKSTNLIHFESQ
jgi:Domain of unknown function (DUF1816)